MKRRGILFVFLLVAGLLVYYYFGTEKMSEIKFELGKNIVETAKSTGVPRFNSSKTAGQVSYSINQIPDDIPARYSRPGYEITASSLFAFTMYADEPDNNNLAVNNVTLQFKAHIKTHEAGQAFVEKLIAQFQKGKWQRYIRESCPAVSGRSSLLDEAGNLNVGKGCAFDPSYKLTPEEWRAMMGETQRYEWVGDGVVAKLEVDYSSNITYKIFLEFEDLATMVKSDQENQARDLKEGDAKGWGSTAKYMQGKKETEARNKILEANAIKRGDTVVPR